MFAALHKSQDNYIISFPDNYTFVNNVVFLLGLKFALVIKNITPKQMMLTF